MKIRHQLSLITLTFLGIALILMSTFFYFYATSILKEKNTAFMNESLVSGSMVLENLIETRRVETAYLSQNSKVLAAANDYYNKYKQDSLETIPDYRVLNSYLYTIRTSGRGVRAAFVIGPNGLAIASGHPESIGLNLADRSYFQEAMTGNETISNLLLDRLDGIASLFVASPIFSNDGKETIGVMSLIIDTQSTSDSLRALISKDKGDAYLINSDGMIIFHTDSNLIGSYHRDEKTRAYFLLRQLSASGTWQYRYKGEDYYMVYNSLSNSPWTLVIEQNMSIYMSSVKETLWTLLIILLLILSLAGTAYSLYAKHFTSPIQHLSQVMHQNTTGDLSVRSQYLSNNELGSLSKDLNLMLDELVGAYEETDAAKRQIEELAFFSPITKIANRTAYDYDLQSLFENHSDSFSLIHIDIDNFMRINYSLGHQLGDFILTELATHLKTFETTNLRIYHVSADKFAFLMENSSTNELINFLESLYQSFRTPLLIDQREIFLSLSTGISSYPIDGLTAETLKNHAEAALYEAKNSGKGRYVFYQKIMTDKVHRRIEIETVLRRAIKDNLIYIMYQPQYKTGASVLNSFEALMRLKTEEGKIISPAEFIPIAEDTGLIIELSLWMFNEVFQLASEWISSGHPFEYICVNISAQHLKLPAFATSVIEIAEKHQLPFQKIELEITEGILIDLSSPILQMLENLKGKGFRIALDDFGTGYSSLSYLRSLPLNTLKIDKIFIDELVSSNKDQELVRQIIELAHELSLHVVAEGVEKKEQLTLLYNFHCDLIQGYYYSKPLLKEDVFC